MIFTVGLSFSHDLRLLLCNYKKFIIGGNKIKAIEKLKTKKDEIKTKIDDHSEQISNVLIAAGAGIWLVTTAYAIGRWRAAKYATGLMFLAREAGLMEFEPYAFLNFIDDHPQKEVFKDWKRIGKMK